MKLAEKLEDQKKQNRAYVEVRPFPETSLSCLECSLHPLLPCPLITKTRDRQQGIADVQQFKAQERESQRYRSKKKERAFLKAIPIIPVSSTSFRMVKLIYSQLPLFSFQLLPNLATRICRSFQNVVIPQPTFPRI